MVASKASDRMCDSTSTVVSRLQTSGLFRDYQRAFEATTGLPLVFRRPGAFQAPMRESRRLNPFCALMAATNQTCAACLCLQQELEQSASNGAATLECYAGLIETAVPVRIGSVILGYLRTGQIFLRPPSQKKTETLMRDLARNHAGSDSPEARSAYLNTRVMRKAQYTSIIRLLTIFADHLAAVSNQVMIRESLLEPPAITKARMFISEHQSEDLSLREAARAVHMSDFYFCKAFKRATGLTFTGYLARTRIESVKARLLNVHVHISEAAYEAGFRSLSQFNRVFRRITGESPSDYRERINSRSSMSGRRLVHAA